MHIRLLCVGKLKETYWRDAVAEYAKRLARYHALDIVEVPDEPAGKRSSDAQVELVRDREGAALLAKIGPRDKVIALCVDGHAPSSPELADALRSWEGEGNGSIVFLIGGSHGLSDAVLSRSAMRLSFSRMTFPHNLMRVILLEQLYRAAKINAGETYHK